MTRTFYDGINSDARAIPVTAQGVCGYDDGLYAWSAADWARFPNSVHVHIAVFAATNSGHVLDVEKGNATPAQSVDWVLMRRRAGADPTVYCNVSTWPLVRGAFQARGVAEPHYWIALYDGNRSIPPGAIGKQYADNIALGMPYDLSAVADYWPGVDPPQGADMPLTPQDIAAVAKAVYEYGEENVTLPGGKVVGASLGNLAHGAWVATNDASTGNAALAAAVAKLAAPAPVDVKALAAALASTLGPALTTAAEAGVQLTADQLTVTLEQHLGAALTANSAKG